MSFPSLRARRCLREYRDVVESEEMMQGQIKLELLRGSWNEMLGEIMGPVGSPYEGGHFKLHIEIPETYPSGPPKIKFNSYVWHPNVSSVTGCICLNILKDNWAPILTLKTILLSLQVLLSSAEPDDPQDLVVATQYKHHPELFDMTARHWTNIYANGPHAIPECDEKVASLMEMGVEVHTARVSLSMNRWDLHVAAEKLFFSN